VAGGDPNLYLYCHNDPLNSVDPSGLQPDEDDPFEGVGYGINDKGEQIRWGPGVERGRRNAEQLGTVVRTGASLHPGVAIAEAAYGKDCSGRKLSGGERTVAVVGAVAPGGGGFLAKGRQLIGRGIRWLGRLIGIGGKATGQTHHVLSNKIMSSLNKHSTLKGQFGREDFKVQAFASADHCGYQAWHRAYDLEVSKWLADNQTATRAEFIQFLRGLYSSKEMRTRFPDALKVIK